MIKTVVKYSL